MTFFEDIKNYIPFDDEEAIYKQRVLDLLASTDIPFSRENLAGHITGSAFVTNQTGDKVLMIHHKKLKIWVQPGGHCDGDSDVAGVALREVMEETGLSRLTLVPGIYDVDVHPIAEAQKNGKIEPPHYHYDVRYKIIGDDTETPAMQEEEILGVRWFTYAEAAQINPWRNFTRMLDKALS